MAEVIINIPDDLQTAIDLLIDNNIEYIKPALLRQVLYVIAGKIPGPADGSFTAQAPLSYDPFTNTFVISQASASTDGFITASDYLNFSTGGSHNFVGIGERLVFKSPSNSNPANKYILEANDLVIAIVEGKKIEGIYSGGNSALLASYDIINSYDL